MPQTPTDEERWSQAAAWSRSTHLNELETTMWRSERHPEQSSTIAALLILDRAPEAERLAAAHAWAAELVPRVRQRVVEPLLPTGPPAWVNDNDFDLGYHLRRQLIWPGSERKALLGMVRTLLLTPFDRRRPLWEATLIEGLAGGRAAYLLKAHHSLADGVGMIQLLSGLNSRTRGHIADKPVTAATDPVWQQTVSPWEVTVDGVSAFVRAAVDASPDVLGGLAGAVLNPVAALSASQRYLASFRRTVIPPDAGTQSPLLRRRTGRSWSLRYLDCSLAELRAAGKAAGGSINDAYLAALLGGLRRYHERHDVVVDDIPITVPVSLRGASDPLGGNKFAGAVLPGPVGVVDPVERIAQVRGLMLAATTEPALDAVMAPSSTGCRRWWARRPCGSALGTTSPPPTCRAFASRSISPGRGSSRRSPSGRCRAWR